MSSLWRSKPKFSGREANGDDAHPNGDGQASPRTRDDHHDNADERTRLLPGGGGYLNPDDPAVSELHQLYYDFEAD